MTFHESDRIPEDLIQGYLDGSLTPEEAGRLLEILRDAPEGVERLLEGLRTDILIRNTIQAVEEEVVSGHADASGLHVDLVRAGDEPLSTPSDRTLPVDENEVRRIKEYAEYQLELFLAEQERQKRWVSSKKRGPRSTLDVKGMATRIDRLMAITARAVVAVALCVAVVIVIASSVQYHLSHRVVATLGNAAQARWNTELPAQELKPGRMILEQGLAQIVFRSGAEVILQAPSVFRLQSSNGLFLEGGRLTAKVPKEARGFTVRTSGAKVIDFGTEFGIMVGTESSAEVHVFDGRIGLASASQGGAIPLQKLEQGEAATVDRAGHIVRSSLVNRPRLFLREIPGEKRFAVPGVRLNLADIVGGGNGFDTGNAGQGINLLTGDVETSRWVVQSQGRGFVDTPSLPFVDGVFVPGSGKAPRVVSSTGVVFQGHPEASGFCYEGIRNGAAFQHQSFNAHPGRLAGVTFGTPEHPSIGLHANAGITFDLDKIRSTLPEVEISCFQSLCGISETVAEYSSDGTWESRRIRIGFWVLVDGRVRFSKELAAVGSESQRINIPLGPMDRFLTLMTTTADAKAVLCWSMFTEPMLELTKGRQVYRP